MSESKHTEGKLVVITPARAGSSFQLYSPEGNGHLVALLSPSNSDPENTAANADRLALTWNCHDDLLEALKEARETIKTWHNMGIPNLNKEEVWRAYQSSPEMKTIDAAIALAEATS